MNYHRLVRVLHDDVLDIIKKKTVYRGRKLAVYVKRFNRNLRIY